jgi:hypothetical protein
MFAQGRRGEQWEELTFGAWFPSLEEDKAVAPFLRAAADS